MPSWLPFVFLDLLLHSSATQLLLFCHHILPCLSWLPDIRALERKQGRVVRWRAFLFLLFLLGPYPGGVLTEALVTVGTVTFLVGVLSCFWSLRTPRGALVFLGGPGVGSILSVKVLFQFLGSYSLSSAAVSKDTEFCSVVSDEY